MNSNFSHFYIIIHPCVSRLSKHRYELDLISQGFNINTHQVNGYHGISTIGSDEKFAGSTSAEKVLSYQSPSSWSTQNSYRKSVSPNTNKVC